MKCNNCLNEHDGSYSDRFCSKKCRYSWIGKQSYRTMLKNKTFPNNLLKVKPTSKSRGRKPYGTWKCDKCNLIFNTRLEKENHNKKYHPIDKNSSWDKGLTIETDERVM